MELPSFAALEAENDTLVVRFNHFGDDPVFAVEFGSAITFQVDDGNTVRVHGLEMRVAAEELDDAGP